LLLPGPGKERRKAGRKAGSREPADGPTSIWVGMGYVSIPFHCLLMFIVPNFDDFLFQVFGELLQ
jgi:hypothetical protein